MTDKNFKRALNFVLRWEGGYVNHPMDSGGPTNRGITQATYDAWRRSRGQPIRSVKEIDEREIEDIYYQFWAPWCPDLDWPLCLAVFDSFVQFGHRGCALLWQPIVGAQADGIWGRATQALTLEFQRAKGPRWAALQLALARVKYRATRVSQKPDQKVFLAGWLARDANLIEKIFE